MVYCYSSSMRKILVVCSAMLSLVTFSFDLPESAVEQYQLDSHLGLSDPMLNALFPKAGKFEVSLGGAYSPYSNYMNYFSVLGSVVYHINRRHAIEPLYFGFNMADTTSFVENEIGAPPPVSADALSVELPDQVFLASYQYSPFYSKMHITAQSVAHFDVYFGIGGGIVQTTHKFLSGREEEGESRVAGSLSAGMRIFMQRRWALRFEIRDIISELRNIGDESFQNTIQFSLGFSMFFGSFPNRVRGT